MEHIAQKCSEKDVLKFLVGNKCDLEEERRITYEDLLDKAVRNTNVMAVLRQVQRSNLGARLTTCYRKLLSSWLVASNNKPY